MSLKIALACSLCGMHNYKTVVAKNSQTKRLQLRKYCAHCQKHTVHKQA